MLQIPFRVLWGFYRTNNHAEGWHRGMKSKFEKAGQNIYKFIRVLYKEALNKKQLLFRLRAGEAPRRAKRAIREKNERILNIVRQYGDRDRLDFLSGIAPNVRLG